MDDGLVIETRELGKRYDGRIVAVDKLSLRVQRGEVYGFLGPNGAGKTTTLRMLLGLVRPTSGSALVLGAPPGSPESLARVGALIESPTFYPFLSGRDNLRVLARYSGAPEARIEAVLGEVDLAGRAGDRFGTYSLGMKQRLGIAGALLKDPELLILDEPTNGMDPAGMAEMRGFIRESRARPANGAPLQPPDERGRAGLRPRRRDQQGRARPRGNGGRASRPREPVGTG
jgi:ABC-2 type transport system ATP-binding protein